MYTVIFLNSKLYHSENNLLYSILKAYYYGSIHPYVLEINFLGLNLACRTASVSNLHLHICTQSTQASRVKKIGVATSMNIDD